eukprot:TRINITY_DN1367_c0_g1_i11.p1 TRINITY_DN1367_c0_g1~~TRINITY_DN1367_c0_g1_i11.p1  ORF type:complete len:370 (-),score=92.65 TRINITY_DN1367_c0_g1_i11:1327-2436(-)
MTQFYQKGIELVGKAISADEREQYEDAMPLYIRGIEYMLTGLKYEKHQKVKGVVRTKVVTYLQRAELLKPVVESIKAQRTAKQSVTSTRIAAASALGDTERQQLRGSLQDAILKERPNVKWTDVIGLETAKAALREAAVLPVQHPELFTGKRKPWQGILLYGPPGTGKSYLAKAVATEVKSTFFSISSSDLVSKHQGESERLIKELFRMAQEQAPSVVFIDEVDAIARNRSGSDSDAERRIKTEFLTNLQGVTELKGVTVLAATNQPWDLDPAVRRRFEKRIYIPLPEEQARAAMFQANLKDVPSALTMTDIQQAAQATEGYSGADIAVLCRDTLMQPVRRAVNSEYFRTLPSGLFSCHICLSVCLMLC